MCFQVVEYSEIGDRNAEMLRPDGKLTYYAGNICNHFFTTDYLDQVYNFTNNKSCLALLLKNFSHLKLLV
jgi:UDP-N-acetylglucosamine pyrophosphorylase